jgi:hypothetical protein
MTSNNTKQSNYNKQTEICESFGELVTNSIKHEKLINLDMLDATYLKLKNVIEIKNNEINSWYDETYHKNILDLNTNTNNFAKLINKNSNDVLSITY